MNAVPQWAVQPGELDDVECMVLGAYGELRCFPEPGAGELGGGSSGGASAPGPPVTPTLFVPAAIARDAQAQGRLDLLDAEGTPVASVAVSATWPLPAARDRGGQALVGVGGMVSALRPFEREARYRRADATTHAGAVLGVPVELPPVTPVLEALRAAADRAGARLLVLPLTGAGRPRLVDGSGLVRSWLAVAPELGAEIVPVPVPAHRGDPVADRALPAWVAAAYGATAVIGPPATGIPAQLEVLALPASVEEAVAQVIGYAGRGEPVPEHLAPEATLRELRRAHRLGGGRGAAVLLTGLSGSGKSTIARSLAEALLERTDRTVTLLDGDVVRRMLSSELTFSRADRELNVRRIGFLAALVAQHGGIAICAPIAPYAAMRAEMRAMVEAHGGFLLVHVATPLEVCEARDRKGLYAKARAGLIPEFTGVSDPYEEPLDADLRIDTAEVPTPAAVEQILDQLRANGWVTGLAGPASG